MSSPPMRQARRSSQISEQSNSRTRRPSITGGQSGIPMSNSRLRQHNTNPTYDFISGGSTAPPLQPLGQSFRQSQVVKPDIGNEDLRAQIKTLQYEVDSLKQDRELSRFQHEKELRDTQSKAEEIFRKAQTEESNKHIPVYKFEALKRELKDSQDQAVNQQNTLEKRVRAAQEESRAAKEEAEEAQTEFSSRERQHDYRLREIESKHSTLQKTLSDLRDDLAAKSSALQSTQDKLSHRETETGQLESEILRLKAQTGDADTLAVIKRELSEQVAHIRRLESTNREQNTELKHFRRIHKAVEVVEEEKRALENRVSQMNDLNKQLGEAQVQRQILEDERRSWTSYLQNQGETDEVEFESPEDMARALVKERLGNASLLQRMGALQPELSEKDEIIKSLEEELTKIRTEVEKTRASGGGAGDARAKARLERQRALAVKEVDYLREQFKTYDSEEQTYHSENQFDEQKAKRISDLESLVDEYRRELQNLSTELEKADKSTPAPPQTPSKRPREDDPEDGQHFGQLSRKNRKLQDSLSTLQSNHVLLQTSHAALQTQVTALQKSARTRILTLRSNPTTDAEAIKQITLTTLKQENADLLAQLEKRNSGSKSGDGPPQHSSEEASTTASSRPPPPTLVPQSTLDALRLEMDSLTRDAAEKEKRMLRLKQIWAKKSLEFREAVFSLLGWKMDFRPDGKYALSLHSGAPPAVTDGEAGGDDGGGGGGSDDEEERCLIFDGEKGTMKVAGGPESKFGYEVRPLIRRWVEGKGYLPGLMASILLSRVDDGGNTTNLVL